MRTTLITRVSPLTPSMRIGRLALFVAALIIPSAAPAQTAWERYLKLPTPANARRVQVASYSDTAVNESAIDRLEEDFGLLEIQMDAHDREAVRLAFRLTKHAGSDDGEALDIMLGRLVRIDPALFLDVLREQAGDGDCNAGGNYGVAYVDRPDAARYETERRIAALQTVTRRDLKAIRARCIASLRAALTARAD